MTTFLAPGVLLAFHIYPNAFGAAAIGFAFRFGITAPVRRPLLAGIAAGLTLFLNPRDGLVLAVLLVAMWWVGKRDFRRFAIGAAAVAIVAAGSSESVLADLPHHLEGQRVLLPRGQDASEELPAGLAQRGAHVLPIVLYRKVLRPRDGNLDSEIVESPFAAFCATSPAAARSCTWAPCSASSWS